MNKYNTHKNKEILEYNYNVGEKVMRNNKSAYKYETPYNGSFDITQCWSNGTVILQMGATKNR